MILRNFGWFFYGLTFKGPLEEHVFYVFCGLGLVSGVKRRGAGWVWSQGRRIFGKPERNSNRKDIWLPFWGWLPPHEVVYFKRLFGSSPKYRAFDPAISRSLRLRLRPRGSWTWWVACRATRRRLKRWGTPSACLVSRGGFGGEIGGFCLVGDVYKGFVRDVFFFW